MNEIINDDIKILLNSRFIYISICLYTLFFLYFRLSFFNKSVAHIYNNKNLKIK